MLIIPQFVSLRGVSILRHLHLRRAGAQAPDDAYYAIRGGQHADEKSQSRNVNRACLTYHAIVVVLRGGDGVYIDNCLLRQL